MIKKIILVILFLFCLIFNTTKAQITLIPETTSFILVSIRLNLIDSDKDYTQSKQYIGILGDKKRIDIFWDANYEPKITDPSLLNINVTCWLNCEARNSSELYLCQNYQSCNYVGPTGFAYCSIQNPNYNYSAQNKILCKFSNPNYPELEFVLSDGSYPRRAFYPIRYSISSIGGVYQVGSTISFPISFLSYSFLKSNYTAFIYLRPEDIGEIYVDNTYNTTKVLKYGEIDTVYPTIVFLTKKDNIIFYINSTSNELPSFNSIDSCPSPQIILGKDAHLSLIDGKCIYSFEVISGSTYYSMPEYDQLFAFIIILTSVMVFCLILKFR
ncbi:MAG: hypothetical protein QXX30_04805 [Candidatus Aenigmatarchaeota archaeon]